MLQQPQTSRPAAERRVCRDTSDDATSDQPELVVCEASSVHNGRHSTINLSYQIVLQDHNYGAPPPTNNSESCTSVVQCKQEQLVESVSPSATIATNQGTPQQQRVSLKALSPRPAQAAPQPGRLTKASSTSEPTGKKQRTNSNSNGIIRVCPPTSPVAKKEALQRGSCGVGLVTPPLVLPRNTPLPGDLNSHLYASVDSIDKQRSQVKDEQKSIVINGMSVFNVSSWNRAGERPEDSFNEDSNESDRGSELDTGEETDTAPENGDDYEQEHEGSITRCICKFGHDDGYMICCDGCSVWQHVECMNLDRNNIPDEYLCEICQPRRVDHARARAVQYRKRQDLRMSTPPALPGSGGGGVGAAGRRRSTKDELIDVELSPKKNCRTVVVPVVGAKRGKTGRSAGRPEGTKMPGKRGTQQKWKRKLDKHDEVDGKERRKRKVFRSKAPDAHDVGSGGAWATDGGGVWAADSPMSSSGGSRCSGGSNNSGVGGGGGGGGGGNNFASAGSEFLLQWIDHYEEAVTNHYSPELRARVAAVVRPNGVFSDLFAKLSPKLTPFRLASKAGGFKTLVASAVISARTPIIECRGKYMLATQLRCYKPSHSDSGVRPTPHIIYHHLATTPTTGDAVSNGGSPSTGAMVEMCVDGRTYGNEARFVWQSCHPNADVRHVVEKGSVHLYLVAKVEILESEEITVAHDPRNPLPCPYEGCPHMTGSKDCSGARTGLAVLAAAVEATTPPVAGADAKRKRGRRNSAVTDIVPTTAPETAPLTPPCIAAAPAPTAPSTTSPTSVVIASPVTVASAAAAAAGAGASSPAAVMGASSAVALAVGTPVRRQHRTPSKLTAGEPVASADDSPDGYLQPHDELDGPGASARENKKLSREERKMEAIMKRIERMEKAEQRRQEHKAKATHPKDHSKDEDGHENIDPSNSPAPPAPSASAEKKDLNNFDTKSCTLRKGSGKRGGRLRRASSGANSGCRSRMRVLSGEIHSGHSATEEELEPASHNSSSSPGNGGTPVDENRDMSVMAFKCPKTKKVVFNNWNVESGDLNGGKSDLNDPSCGSNPLSLSVPMCYMRNPNPRSPTRPIRTAHLRTSTLASFKPSAGSGSPDHGEGSQSNDESPWAAPLPGGAGGSAKKRWLRQAISEETENESPPAGGLLPTIPCGVDPVLDHVTPLKKRRLARASMSSETSFTPPSTPTPTHTSGSVDALQLADKDHSAMESLSADNSQSTPPQCEDMDVDNFSARIGAGALIVGPGGCKGFTVDNLSQASWIHAPLTNDPPSTEAPPPLEPHVRPTWEFRAPDAQFLVRQRISSAGDGPDSPAPTTTNTDAAPPESSVASSAGHHNQPKPIKRKLSILEYRQRKQNMNGDDSSAGATRSKVTSEDDEASSKSRISAGGVTDADSCSESASESADESAALHQSPRRRPQAAQ